MKTLIILTIMASNFTQAQKLKDRIFGSEDDRAQILEQKSFTFKSRVKMKSLNQGEMQSSLVITRGLKIEEVSSDDGQDCLKSGNKKYQVYCYRLVDQKVHKGVVYATNKGSVKIKGTLFLRNSTLSVAFQEESSEIEKTRAFETLFGKLKVDQSTDDLDFN